MKKRFVAGLSLAILLTLVVYKFDTQIIQLVQDFRNIYLDYLFISIAFASNVFITFFFLTSLFLWAGHKRRWIVPLWLSGALSVAVSYVLKVLVSRPRPFYEASILAFGTLFYFMKDNFNTWNSSFPSFQAMFVFSALPILSKQYKVFKHVWFIFACLVAFSRVYFGVHYMSDILTGAIIGYMIGYMMVLVEEKYSVGIGVMRKLKINK